MAITPDTPGQQLDMAGNPVVLDDEGRTWHVRGEEVVSTTLQRDRVRLRHQGYTQHDSQDAALEAAAAHRTEATQDEGPSRSANAAEWKAYALSKGMDPAVVENATRKELLEHYLDGAAAPTLPAPAGEPVDPGSTGTPPA